MDIDLVLGESGLTLLGRTTPDDLPFQLDLLTAYATDPGYRPEAMQRYLDRLAPTYAQMAATPGGVVPGPVALLLHDGDTRFAMPTQAQAEQRTLTELREWLTPQLRDGPLRVVAVGDIEPARLIEEVGRTFGALPARGAATRPVPPTLRPSAASEPFGSAIEARPTRRWRWSTGRRRAGPTPRRRSGSIWSRTSWTTGCCRRCASARVPPTRPRRSATCP